MSEPKRISVSQVARYKSEGWSVVEYTECGRYAYVVKEELKQSMGHGIEFDEPCMSRHLVGE